MASDPWCPACRTFVLPGPLTGPGPAEDDESPACGGRLRPRRGRPGTWLGFLFAASCLLAFIPTGWLLERIRGRLPEGLVALLPLAAPVLAALVFVPLSRTGALVVVRRESRVCPSCGDRTFHLPPYGSRMVCWPRTLWWYRRAEWMLGAVLGLHLVLALGEWGAFGPGRASVTGNAVFWLLLPPFLATSWCRRRLSRALRS